MNFAPYPFERLREFVGSLNITQDSAQDSKLSRNKAQVAQDSAQEIRLTIGEPQFETPDFIQEALAKNSHLLNKYPNSGGEDYLKDSMIEYCINRFGVNLARTQIIPTLGTREVLFNFPCFFLSDKNPKIIAFPNPFYQIYEGAAIASGAQIIHMNLDLNNSFKPQLDEHSFKNANLVILNSPNNPTGAILDKNELGEWVECALKYDFVILSDECYSDIYEKTPPPSILEACLEVGNKNFKNILALNSISKRSSAPGLRSGFIAGDSEILARYKLYRTYIGTASPLPLQIAASAAWRDNKSSQIFRAKYAANLRTAREILGINVNPYTFYVWLFVKDDLEFCKKLYENERILVLPGRFLGRNGAGEGFVRIALVYENEIIKNALQRLKKWI